jgi:hypothetical protein
MIDFNDRLYNMENRIMAELDRARASFAAYAQKVTDYINGREADFQAYKDSVDAATAALLADDEIKDTEAANTFAAEIDAASTALPGAAPPPPPPPPPEPSTA